MAPAMAPLAFAAFAGAPVQLPTVGQGVGRTAAPAQLPTAAASRASALASGSLAGLSIAVAAATRRPRRSALRAQLETPAIPKGNHGQAFFDPLGLSTDGHFEQSRKVELVVARLAMLGAVGLPLAEIMHEDLADMLGLESKLAEGGMAPALHTGGIFSPGVEVSMATVLILACALAVAVKQRKEEARFDLLTPNSDMSMPAVSPVIRSMIREGEMFNGRVAMVAVVVMCMQEMITGKAIVDSPIFFGAH
mmetsp:Transcript_22864/g.60398  ORF Transcript_22864/g.60398 Transcript_22864/m.60398 type:complete len:250 (-) Transcript_22864:58-807(-)